MVLALFFIEPPSKIRNLIIVTTTSTTISLAWDPADSGGRDDLVYIVFFREEGSNDIIQAETVQASSATITGEYNARASLKGC